MKEFFAFAAMALVFFSLGFLCGRESEDFTTRAEAIRAGVAEYYLDANNEKQFRWKAVKP